MSGSPEATLQAYIEAFETLDPRAALAFYDVPSVFVAPQGVVVMTDAATALATLDGFMRNLRAQSYRRTTVSGLQSRSLSSELASCTGVFTRFNTSDQEIARIGFTYTMSKTGGSWKIVVAVVHDPM